MEVVFPLPAKAFHAKPEGRKVAKWPTRTRIEELHLQIEWPHRMVVVQQMHVTTPGDGRRDL
jgi:hypothetical protein